jgi:hypothetical protein
MTDTKLYLSEVDVIFISYDEPNADKNYSELIRILPWAKRIHGVKGSDAAHKAAANLSETDRFVSVDADNIVDPTFFQQVITLTEENKDFVFSWCGQNAVNGLIYGNGGLKCWTKDFVLNMKTHENADDDDSERHLEFCFDPRYYQMNEHFSTSYINGSPFQAWRAGFREGVKMSLNRGARTDNIKGVWWQNYQRLLIWMNIGADVKNGLWAIYGARLGCYMTMCTEWDHVQVRDFEYLTNLWVDESNRVNDDNLLENIQEKGQILRNELNLEVAEMDANASKFFKSVYQNTPRVLRR